jgi:glycosyltransferase involved in cell wall biosynthesis
VVVPVYNEVDNIPTLHDSLTRCLEGLDKTYEIIVIDDGSTDGSRELLGQLVRRDPHLRAVSFRRNCGQTAAMAVGFDLSRGEIIVTMDGDLQNDPADIPRLLTRLEEGFDVVCGWRRNRKDPLLTRLLPSKLANALISWVTGVRIHDTGCSLKAYRSWVVRSLRLYSDMHRFIAALGAGLGARISEVPVRHHRRRFGRSKYGLWRIFQVLVDLLVIKMLIQFSAHPIRQFGLLALPLFLITPVLFAVGLFRFTEEGVILADTYDILDMAAGAVTLLVALNVFLLGFLAELQIKASRFFKRHIAVTAREAAR